VKIGFDLDGVLCDFCSAYSRLLNSKFDTQIPVSDDPADYHWARDYVTRKQEHEAWAFIDESPFWLTHIEPATGVDWLELGHLHIDAEVYFITARHTTKAKQLSAQWLRRQGLGNPAVLCTKQKGLVAEALGLNIFIDDDPAMCRDVKFRSPFTRVYLRARAYNQSAHAALRAHGIQIVADVNEMLARETETAADTNLIEMRG
jgi:uncharacterized HAD superfamily protein